MVFLIVMRVQLFLAFLTLMVTYCLSAPTKYVETNMDNNSYYENYDDDPLDHLELDDETGSDLNVIGRSDELRQIILNPRKRRERRRKHQGKIGKFYKENESKHQ